jgi:glutaryl-CoA dehydrogenase
VSDTTKLNEIAKVRPIKLKSLITMAAKTDLFQSPDYYLVDELLNEEHKLIRETVRNYVKKEISPIIEDYAQRAEFPEQIVKQLGELGCFGPTIPQEYGGGGLDYISYGLMMQECKVLW